MKVILLGVYVTLFVHILATNCDYIDYPLLLEPKDVYDAVKIRTLDVTEGFYMVGGSFTDFSVARTYPYLAHFKQTKTEKVWEYFLKKDQNSPVQFTHIPQVMYGNELLVFTLDNEDGDFVEQNAISFGTVQLPDLSRGGTISEIMQWRLSFDNVFIEPLHHGPQTVFIDNLNDIYFGIKGNDFKGAGQAYEYTTGMSMVKVSVGNGGFPEVKWFIRSSIDHSVQLSSVIGKVDSDGNAYHLVLFGAGVNGPDFKNYLEAATVNPSTGAYFNNIALWHSSAKLLDNEDSSSLATTTLVHLYAAAATDNAFTVGEFREPTTGQNQDHYITFTKLRALKSDLKADMHKFHPTTSNGTDFQVKGIYAESDTVVHFAVVWYGTNPHVITLVSADNGSGWHQSSQKAYSFTHPDDPGLWFAKFVVDKNKNYWFVGSQLSLTANTFLCNTKTDHVSYLGFVVNANATDLCACIASNSGQTFTISPLTIDSEVKNYIQNVATSSPTISVDKSITPNERDWLDTIKGACNVSEIETNDYNCDCASVVPKDHLVGMVKRINEVNWRWVLEPFKYSAKQCSSRNIEYYLYCYSDDTFLIRYSGCYSWFDFDPNTPQVIFDKDTFYAGEYYIQVRGVHPNTGDNGRTNAIVSLGEATGPYFAEDIVYDKLIYPNQKVLIKLPEILDAENNYGYIFVECRGGITCLNSRTKLVVYVTKEALGTTQFVDIKLKDVYGGLSYYQLPFTVVTQNQFQTEKAAASKSTLFSNTTNGSDVTGSLGYTLGGLFVPYDVEDQDHIDDTLSAQIQTVNSTGAVFVKFNREMADLDISKVKMDSGIIELTAQNGGSTEQSLLNFTWYVSEFIKADRTVVIQLLWENPHVVSLSQSKDVLKMTILKNGFFVYVEPVTPNFLQDVLDSETYSAEFLKEFQIQGLGEQFDTGTMNQFQDNNDFGQEGGGKDEQFNENGFQNNNDEWDSEGNDENGGNFGNTDNSNEYGDGSGNPDTFEGENSSDNTGEGGMMESSGIDDYERTRDGSGQAETGMTGDGQNNPDTFEAAPNSGNPDTFQEENTTTTSQTFTTISEEGVRRLQHVIKGGPNSGSKKRQRNLKSVTSVSEQATLTALAQGEWFYAISKNTTVTRQLPRQIGFNETNEVLANAASASANLVQTLVFSNLILNIFLSLSLQQLWTIVNCLQIYAHFTLMRINLPIHVLELYSLLQGFLQYEIFPIEKQINNSPNIKFSDQQGLNSRFSDAGFGSVQTLSASPGDYFMLLLLWSIALVMLLIQKLTQMCKGRNRFAAKTYTWTKANTYDFFFQATARWLLEGAFELLITCSTNFVIIYRETTPDKISLGMASVMLSILILLPFWMFRLIYHNTLTCSKTIESSNKNESINQSKPVSVSMKKSFWEKSAIMRIKTAVIRDVEALKRSHTLKDEEMAKIYDKYFEELDKPQRFCCCWYHPRFGRARLKEKNRHRKYQTFWEEQNKRRPLALLFNFVFILRRFAVCYIYIFLEDWPSQQIQLILFMQTIILVYVVAARPYNDRMMNFKEVFNETSILVLCYHVIMCTDFTIAQVMGDTGTIDVTLSTLRQAQIVDGIGYSMVSFSFAHIGFHLISVVLSTILSIKTTFLICRKKWVLFKRQKIKKSEKLTPEEEEKDPEEAFGYKNAELSPDLKTNMLPAVDEHDELSEESDQNQEPFTMIGLVTPNEIFGSPKIMASRKQDARMNMWDSIAPQEDLPEVRKTTPATGIPLLQKKPVTGEGKSAQEFRPSDFKSRLRDSIELGASITQFGQNDNLLVSIDEMMQVNQRHQKLDFQSIQPTTGKPTLESGKRNASDDWAPE